MININTYIKALHISRLRRIIKQLDNVSWCSVSNINFENYLILVQVSTLEDSLTS